MKQDKLEFEAAISHIRAVEKDHKKLMRLAVQSEGGSCLTCKHTKTAVGSMLKCNLKAKYVNQHSYCEYWKPDCKQESEK